MGTEKPHTRYNRSNVCIIIFMYNRYLYIVEGIYVPISVYIYVWMHIMNKLNYENWPRRKAMRWIIGTESLKSFARIQKFYFCFRKFNFCVHPWKRPLKWFDTHKLWLYELNILAHEIQKEKKENKINQDKHWIYKCFYVRVCVYYALHTCTTIINKIRERH